MSKKYWCGRCKKEVNFYKFLYDNKKYKRCVFCNDFVGESFTRPKTETKKSKIEKCQEYINYINELGFYICEYCVHCNSCTKQRVFYKNDYSCETGHSAIKLCTDFQINKDIEILEEQDTIF